MDTIGIRELRENLTSALRRVERGESLQVTHHGRPVALLGPVPASRLEQLIASGEVTRTGSRWPKPLAPTDGPTLSEILQRDRDDD